MKLAQQCKFFFVPCPSVIYQGNYQLYLQPLKYSAEEESLETAGRLLKDGISHTTQLLTQRK